MRLRNAAYVTELAGAKENNQVRKLDYETVFLHLIFAVDRIGHVVARALD